MSPWAAQGDRGSSVAYLFNPGNVFMAKFTVAAQGMDTAPHERAVRLERRYSRSGSTRP